jgi:glutamine cyclotransferase
MKLKSTWQSFFWRLRHRLLAILVLLYLPIVHVGLAAVPVQPVKIVQKFPHDPNAFTQGLEVFGSELLEGTGRYGKSELRRVELASGEVLQSYKLGRRYFGEGITLLKDKVFQLTWRSHFGFVYDAKTFSRERFFLYSGEGWGLTNNGSELIMSDGTAQLRFLDPTTLQVVRVVTVTEEGSPLTMLNELEFVQGEVWANIWYSSQIVRIHPDTGEVIGRIELGTLERPGDPDAVANGIAWDSKEQRLFVTGKLWEHLYEIKLLPAIGNTP